MTLAVAISCNCLLKVYKVGKTSSPQVLMYILHMT